MNITQLLKFFALILVTGSLIAGCAGTTEEEPKVGGGGDASAAIAAAERAYKIALDEMYAWRDTGKLIKKAKEALKAGKDTEAIKLANKAKKQADDAVAQKYSELDRIKDMIKLDLPEDKASTGNSGDYQVVRGDNLWDISGKAEIYSNPYQWPLIYKANQDKIKDADLIYPGQNLVIEQGASAGEVDAAINHAKTRGSWSIGTVEASDKAYLSK